MDRSASDSGQDSGEAGGGRLGLQLDIDLLFRRHPSPMWVYDRPSLRFLAVNDAAVQTYGYSAGEFLGMTLRDIRDASELDRLLRAAAAEPAAYRRHGHWQHRARDGRALEVLVATYGVLFDGRPASLSVMTDVTDERAALRRLSESEQRLRQAQRLARIGDWIWYPGGEPQRWQEGRAEYSEQAAALFGVEPAALSIPNETYLERFVHPDDRAKAANCFYNLGQAQHTGYSLKYRVRHADGTWRVIHEVAENVADAEGRLLLTRGTIQDVTEEERLELRLRQAERMEALGRLTGGVAHDFNNLLTVIIGSVEALRERLEGQDSLAALSDDALAAASRAAELTRRLLTLSRQTRLSAGTLSLAEVLAGLEPLLRRSLGAQVDIETHLPPDLAPVLADRGQLENALINLAVNARDAMPEGGRLRFEATNVTLDEAAVADLPDLRAGRYVLLAVSDNGAGMPRDVAARAFEPFFSTKEAGKGSGLGLATVYGFLRQSGGHAALDSEEGRGTTIRLYLPCAPDRQPSLGATPTAHEPADIALGEVVLVVEDDSAIRQLAVQQLARLGYRTLEAEHGRAAEAILRGTQRIDLLLSDVVMPGGLGGPDLARLAVTLRPGIKCLLVSGYAEDAFAKDGGASRPWRFLPKPYRRQELSRAVRQALDSR